ncbi:hypothetical protein ACFWA9_29115 [Kitasatospora sp. NPDC059973]|uniref:hypothetical protein n=1 Tax=Kitasatospora sp. NPDC059973 TaxID=3347020 RepID=UPI0036835324
MDAQDREPVEGEVVVPLSVEEARALTTEVREAIEDVRQVAGRLAERVKRAHDARVWEVLGYPSWAEYAKAEFGVSRSHAYRLLDLARSAEEITAAVVTLGVLAPVSHAGDMLALDLPIRAVVELRGRMGEVRELLVERLEQVAAEGPGRLAPELVAAVVADVVAEVRARPDLAEEDLDEIEVPPGAPYTAEDVRRGRRLVAELTDCDRQLGMLALEVVPAYRSEAGAALGPLGVLADELGEDVELLLACRRYAVTGDYRAVEEYRAQPLAGAAG